MLHSAPRQAQCSPHPAPWRCAILPVCAVLLLLSGASHAHAQILRGRVVDATTDRGVDSVAITIVDDAGDLRSGTGTDALGRFRLAADHAGRVRLRVERRGYRGFVADAVAIAPGDEIVLEVRLAADRIVIAPITVLGRRRIDDGRDYEARLRLMRAAGIGRSLVRAEIAQREVLEISELLATIPDIIVAGPPRARTVRFAGGADDTVCEPLIFVNGRPLAAAAIDLAGTPLIVDAVELYHGAVESPPEFEDPDGCGVVLIWTRSDVADARPMKWRRAVVYIAMTAVGVVLFSR